MARELTRTYFKKAYLAALGRGFDPSQAATAPILLEAMRQHQVNSGKRARGTSIASRHSYSAPKLPEASTPPINGSTPAKITKPAAQPEVKPASTVKPNTSVTAERQRYLLMAHYNRMQGYGFFKTNPLVKDPKPGSPQSVTRHERLVDHCLGSDFDVRKATATHIATEINNGNKEAIEILNSMVTYLVDQSREFGQHSNQIQQHTLLDKCEKIITAIYQTISVTAKLISVSGIAPQIQNYNSIYPKLNSSIADWLDFFTRATPVKLP